MQRAEESEPRGGGLSPLTGFLIGIGVLMAIAATVLLTHPDTPVPSPDPNPEPAFALTDAEAITRFEELDKLRIRSYGARDATLVSRIFTIDSPIAQKVSREIKTLLREDVFSRTRFETQSIEVIANGNEEIEIRQEVVVRPRFVSESGEDVTQNARVEVQTIEWVLRRDGDEWLLHDALITAAKPLEE